MLLSIMLTFALQILGVLSRAQIEIPMNPSESELPSLDVPPEVNCTCTPFYECYDEESSSIINNVVNDRTVITVSGDDEPGECLDILDICCHNLVPISLTEEPASPSLQPESPNIIEVTTGDLTTIPTIHPESTSLLDVSTHDLTTSSPVQPQSPGLPEVSAQDLTRSPPIHPKSPSTTEMTTQTTTTSPLTRPQTPNPHEIALQFPSSDTSASSSPSPSEISPTQTSTTNTIVLQSETAVSPEGVAGQHIESIRPCGVRNIDGFNFTIAGFKDGQAQYGEFPWMVAVLTSGRDTGAANLYVGGGSLIDPSVVLTAAHKIIESNDTLTARIGEWNFAGTSEPFQTQNIPVIEIIYHPRYHLEKKNYNYALLVLEYPAILGETVGTVCLPSHPGLLVASEECIVSGWGKNVFGEKGRYQRVMKSVTVNMLEHGQCQSAFRKTEELGSTFNLDRGFVCAGDKGQDACTGDGGSPLVCPDPNSPDQYVQVGISAWGIGCGQPGIPGVYAGVAPAIGWITDKLSAIQSQLLEVTDKNVIGPSLRSCYSPTATYTEKCGICIDCPVCHKFNGATCQCHKKVFCRG